MKDMSLTADTSQFDRSWLNNRVPANRWLMLVTADTSHDPIGPCQSLEQSPADSTRHAVTTFFSSFLSRGLNAGVECELGWSVKVLGLTSFDIVGEKEITR